LTYEISAEAKKILDPSQFLAFELAQKSPIVLIQGPPGTGKSHIGRFLVSSFLKMKKELLENAQETEESLSESQKAVKENIVKLRKVKLLITQLHQKEKVAPDPLNRQQIREACSSPSFVPETTLSHSHHQKVALRDQIREELGEAEDELEEAQDDALESRINNENELSGPIMIVTYKNHSLDQFLLGCLKFTKKIVRIGGRSKEEQLDELNLNTILAGSVRPVFSHRFAAQF
jgi:adenylate kinase family enzyme